jgi:hypothetical protein
MPPPYPTEIHTHSALFISNYKPLTQ